MRIVIGSLSHESNSFNPTQMRLEDFSPIYGPDVLTKIKEGGRYPLQGISRVVASYGAEVIPTIFARATPGGLVSKYAYQTMKQGFLRELRQAGKVDGICLHLHGSMTVDGIGDAEGDLLLAIREIVGPEIPIVTSLDMHATITHTMLREADAFVGYRTAPHVDTMETGERAATLLMESLTQGYELQMSAVGLPILISGEQSESAKPPMVSLIKRLEEIDQIPNILSSSLFLGFPWIDVSYSRGAALVVSKEDPELAKVEAKKLAEEFWSRLGEFKFTTEAYPFEEALAVALKIKEGPVCIADCGDNPGAGGSQNIVYPLSYMLEQKVDNALFGAIADSEAFAKCAGQELDTTIDLTFGKMNISPNAPSLSVQAKIHRIGKLGLTPAVAIRVEGIDVIISQSRVMMLDPKDLEELGLDPRTYQLMVLKSGYLDPKYEAIASAGFLALTPGYTNQIFKDLDYKHVTRPIYPLDKGFIYTPDEYLLNK